MRKALSRAAGWRLKNFNYKFPIEQKLFDIYVKLTGQTQPGAGIDAEGDVGEGLLEDPVDGDGELVGEAQQGREVGVRRQQLGRCTAAGVGVERLRRKQLAMTLLRLLHHPVDVVLGQGRAAGLLLVARHPVPQVLRRSY